MSVVVDFLGRLGNNLFQYALGRIIAETQGLALDCERSPRAAPPESAGRNAETSALLEGWLPAFADVRLSIPGRHVVNPTVLYELWPNSPWRGHRIDVSRVLSAPASHVRLRGYFQRYEYYQGYMGKIRDWYRLASPDCCIPLSSRDVVVNIRGGTDFVTRGWDLPAEYYGATLSHLGNIGEVFVCGTGIDDRIVNGLRPWAPTYVGGGPMDHFRLLCRANRVILSNSTFAWWAAALSEATEIHAPRTTDPHRYAFTGYRDVDLHMREGRYHEVTVWWGHTEEKVV